MPIPSRAPPALHRRTYTRWVSAFYHAVKRLARLLKNQRHAALEKLMVKSAAARND